tara:strand:+ start:1249 stop:2211 length:963 start_codon:yes stop_codon:yes gene_type:complete
VNSKKSAYPESWYPLCHSSDLKKGEPLLIEAFDGKLILFRSEDGSPSVVSRFCPHMGTDLSKGTVIKGALRCPFHHRTYGKKGECLKVPGLHEKIKGPGLKSYPTIEKFGLIFMYLGQRPLFDFPSFPRVQRDADFSTALRKDLKTPYSSLLFNGFDTHHLTCIHNREIIAPPIMDSESPYHLRAAFSMKVLIERFYDIAVKFFGARVVDVTLDCWGGNFLIITNKRTKDNILITSVPRDQENSSFFLTTVTNKLEKGLFAEILQRLRLKLTTYLGMAFLKPDEVIVEEMRPDFRSLHPQQDLCVMKFWSFLDSLPKKSI